MRSIAFAFALLITGVFACAEVDRVPDSGPRDSSVADGGALDSGVLDSGVRDSGVRDSGIDDSGIRDASMDASMDGGDAGELMPSADSGSDGGPICEVARCPIAESAPPLKRSHYWEGSADFELRACCITEVEGSGTTWGEDRIGECGIELPGAQYFGEIRCEPLIEGVLDETCLDTVVDGEVVQGCRRTDGYCGHLTAGWGCHHFYRHPWDLQGLDDRDTSLPNPHNCTTDGDPCALNTQCCCGNYSAVCWPESWPHDLPDDWSFDLDGGLPPGVCHSAGSFLIEDFDLTPYPN